MVKNKFSKEKEMEKRPRKTLAEKARAQYTNYAVKEPMELMEFPLLRCRMQAAQN